MKIAIHHTEGSFSTDWINYCEKKNYAYKIVSCYDNDIVKQIEDCDALMWHFHQANCKDILFAKQLLFSLQTSGKVVFPNFHTAWHFDDKLGQKYLLNAMNAPLVPSYAFYDREEALKWADNTSFPKVFKLRSGAGSSQVRLIEDQKSARKVIKKAFGAGFSQYDAGPNLKERWRKYREGLSGLFDVFKGVLRLGYTTDFDRVAGKERGYVYFQDFIPGNSSDTRVIVIDGKAFAIKRLVRKNDFRASGSGHIEYGKNNFDEQAIKLSLEMAKKLQLQCVALDYVYEGKEPLLVEMSYGFSKDVYTKCEGFWDENLNWCDEEFNPQQWMVESVVKKIRKHTSEKSHA